MFIGYVKFKTVFLLFYILIDLSCDVFFVFLS
jgi:hypothetical protein